MSNSNDAARVMAPHNELRLQAALLRTPEFMSHFDPVKFAGQLERIATAIDGVTQFARRMSETAALASAPPSAPAGVEWLRAELNASAAYAGDYIGDERVVLLAVAMRKIDKLAALAQQPATVSALEVFRIAGGDTECDPNPTPERALEVLRDLRACYDEALAQQPAAPSEYSPEWSRRMAELERGQEVRAGSFGFEDKPAAPSGEAVERFRAESEAVLGALKDVCAMHLLMLAADDREGATQMVGGHNMRAAAWRLRSDCVLPQEQAKDKIMEKLSAALALAFGDWGLE